MNWWQRTVFSVASVILGWFSFDLLMTAFRNIQKLKEAERHHDVLGSALLGMGMLILFLLLLTLYLWILRRFSGNLNIVEYEKAEEKPKFRSKWFDILLQCGFLATGFLLRFVFVMLVYLPNALRDVACL